MAGALLGLLLVLPMGGSCDAGRLSERSAAASAKGTATPAPVASQPAAAAASGPAPDQPHDAEEAIAALLADCRRAGDTVRLSWRYDGFHDRQFGSFWDVGVAAGFNWTAARVVSTQWVRGRTRQVYRPRRFRPDRMLGDTMTPLLIPDGVATQWLANCRLSDGRVEVSLLAVVEERETPPVITRVRWCNVVLRDSDFWAERVFASLDRSDARAHVSSWAPQFDRVRDLLPRVLEAKVTYRLFSDLVHRSGCATNIYSFQGEPVAVGREKTTWPFAVRTRETVPAYIILDRHEGGDLALRASDPGAWTYEPPPGSYLPNLKVSVRPASDPSAPRRTVRVKVGPAELDCPDVALTDGVLQLPALRVLEWRPPADPLERDYLGYLLFREGIAVDYWLTDDPAVLQELTRLPACPRGARRGGASEARGPGAATQPALDER